MSIQFPALLVVIPLLMAFFVAISHWLGKNIGFWLAGAALIAAVVDAVLQLSHVAVNGPILYKLGGWMPPMGISYYVDGLSGLVLVVVAVTALVNLLSTKASVAKELGGKTNSFYSLYLLSVCGHLGMTITGDAFNLYVLLEISALSGYALLGMGTKRAPLSTLNYLFQGTIGASLYLLGVGYLYIETGSLNMIDISNIIAAQGLTPVTTTAFCLIMAGVMVKMAFFPLHAWLPGAYSDGPSAASGLIAPMTTKVMVYVMLRMMLTVFTPLFAFVAIPGISEILVWMAVVAILAGGLMALASRNLKRMLTFIIISEVGYMVGGAWLGTPNGLTGSILHIANDAVMTLLVFMVAAAIYYRTEDLSFSSLQGLFKKMPYTMGAFVIGAAAMIGVPPTCGFFSKWYLLLGAFEAAQAGMAGGWAFMAALIVSSLINVVLFFRIFEICLFEPFAEHGHGHGHGGEPTAIAESPVAMVVGLLATATGLIAMGLFTGTLVSIIQTVVPATLP